LKEPSASLLDVNFLVALAWPNHTSHGAARAWFQANRAKTFATCPLTEAGFVRLSMNPLVVGQQVSLSAALELLGQYQTKYTFRFWADDLPLSALAAFRNIAGHRQVTDAYLLALAASKSGVLVTFDGGIAALAPSDDTRHLVVVG